MPRMLVAAALTVVAVISLAGCSSSEPGDVSNIPLQQPKYTAPAEPAQCTDNADLTDAVQAVIHASQPNTTLEVYGEVGGTMNDLLANTDTSNFAAEDNPNGDGVIVSVVYASGPDFARSTATRAGWLVLNNVVYPIDPDGSQAYGLLFNGYPDDVEQQAGIDPTSDGDFDSFGIDDFIAYNSDTEDQFDAFLAAANALCETPTEITG